MRIHLNFDLNSPLSLPLSYHHVLQGFIYDLLSGTPDYSEFLHSTGYDSLDRKYKMFTYSLINGKYAIRDKRIIFSTHISFEISSADVGFIKSILAVLSRKKQFKMYGQELILSRFETSQSRVLTSQTTIRTLSPITIHKTTEENGIKKTLYLSPWDERFSIMLNDNFQRKYLSLYGSPADTNISVEPLKVSERDKYVTTFKEHTLITAWKGIYQLKGSPQAINFLFDTGLGDRNSQGFGIFDYI